MFEAIGNFFKWLFGLPGRAVRAMSLPGCVSCLTCLFLMITVVVVYMVFLYDPFRVPWQHSMTWNRGVLIWVLVFVIPIVVYYALRLWLEGDVSPFPDIDFAWKQGLNELAANGLNIREIPVFIVLGTASTARDEALITGAQLQLRVKEIPNGPAPLHWCASPDGIYLFLTETGALSAIAAQGDAPPKTASVASGSIEAPPLMVEDNAEPTPAPGAMQRPAPRPAGPPPGARGTMVLAPIGSEDPAARMGSGPPPAAPAPGPKPPGPAVGRGTLILRPTDGPSLSGPSPQLQPIGPRMPGAPRQAPAKKPLVGEFSFETIGDVTPESRNIGLSAAQASEQTRRLEYVCYLLKKARKPLCPLNGILTLLPFSVIRIGNREGGEVQRALKSDLATIRRMLQVRCPVNALVVGMEEEQGFRELVRRVGHDRAASQRFGKGFDLWTRPSTKLIEALNAHACAAFESWIYALFRERGALTKPGNTRLYTLLCQVRRTLQPRLASILCAGFADTSDEHPGEEPLLFGGLYFAAVSDKPDRQAFVKGVFDKLVDQQEDIEWTAAAVRGEQRIMRAAYIMIVLDAVLGIAMFGFLAVRYFS